MKNNNSSNHSDALSAAMTENEIKTLTVEVAYALPEKQVVLTTEVPAGASIEQAIKASGVLEKFPEIDLGRQAVGIYSQLKKLSDPVQADDRIEIYRDLIADPKEVRRRRAEQQKKQGIIR